MKKKILSTLLALCMVVAMLPASALAVEAGVAGCDCAGTEHKAAIGTTHYDTLTKANSAATSGQTIDLLGDVTLTKMLHVYNKQVTIEGNSHTITFDAFAEADQGIYAHKNGDI